jgi:hypothetical protein
MPSHLCANMDDKASIVDDEAVRWAAIFSFILSVIVVIVMLTIPAWRSWPKRIVSLIGISIMFIEASYFISAVDNFKDLYDDTTSHFRDTNLCLLQACAFQFSLNVFVLLFLWFQYAQYVMLCHSVSPASVRS